MPTRRTFLKQGCLSSLAFTLPTSLMVRANAVYAATDGLPNEYFRRLVKWCPIIQSHWQKMSAASLAELEEQRGWYHFPYTILPAAVLYTQPNPANSYHGSAQMREFALQIGDLLVREDQAGNFAPRLDSYRDVYMWLEAYTLLKPSLSAAQLQAWQQALARNVALLVPELTAWQNVAAYTENFLGTSPNHYAWWAATVMIGGIHLQRKEWIELGTAVLLRFATSEQNPDGYWGEHNPNSPTGGYNYLTTMAIGLYWEHTKNPRALQALERATHFHSSVTYSDGNLIEIFNDRNRYWEVSPWGQFAFSHWPAGRGYATLLTQHIPDDAIDLDTLGLLAQDALYFHPGPVALCPPEQPNYAYRLSSPAGVRKSGPWTVALCGIVDTPLPNSQWFLDRQAHLAVFHEHAGPILSGANSKHQPELATFAQRLGDSWESTPRGGRLEQKSSGDMLAVAYNSFSAEIIVAPPSHDEMQIDVHINGRGPAPQEAYLGLQLRFKSGTVLTSATGKQATLSREKLHWSSEEMGGALHHGNWSLEIDRDCTLDWPIFPYNPYRGGPDTRLEYAVALLRVPLHLQTNAKQWLQINEQMIHLLISVPRQAQLKAQRKTTVNA